MNTGLSGLCRAGFPLALLLGLTAQGATQDTAYRLEAARVDGTLLLAEPISEDQEFCLHWNHSVAGFLVRDCYAARDGRLYLESSHQPDFAAGLGHYEGRGTLRNAPEGGYLIENIAEAVPNNCLRLKVGAKTVDHTLVVGNDHTSLSQLAARQSITIVLKSDDGERTGQC